MGVFSTLYSMFFKTAQWNEEPNQKQLAIMLAGVAALKLQGDVDFQKGEIEILKFLLGCDYDKSEGGERIVHACSMVHANCPSDIYEAAKQIAERTYLAWHKAWE